MAGSGAAVGGRLRHGAVAARRPSAWGPAIGLWLLASAAADAAMICRITVLPLNFGVYAPGDMTPLDVTGSLELTCVGSSGTLVATLSTGTSGSFAERRMTSGPYSMGYNLYVDASRSVPWGDGTGGSVTVSQSKPGPGRQVFSVPVHGRVFPGQSVGAGTYADDILVTIVF